MPCQTGFAIWPPLSWCSWMESSSIPHTSCCCWLYAPLPMRIGSVAGPLVGGYVLGLGVPVQQMFFVPLVPLAMAVLATLVLVLRKVDVRNEGGGLAH